MSGFKVPSFAEHLNETRGKDLLSEPKDAKLFIDVTEVALKDKWFYKGNPGNKIWYKEGTKRPRAIKVTNPFAKNDIWLFSKIGNSLNGDKIYFMRNWDNYSVFISDLRKVSEKEFLEHRLEVILNKIEHHIRQDNGIRNEAQAAGSTKNIFGTDSVDPRRDYTFAAFFAKKYKLDIKKAINNVGGYLSVNDLDYALKTYPKFK